MIYDSEPLTHIESGSKLDNFLGWTRSDINNSNTVAASHFLSRRGLLAFRLSAFCYLFAILVYVMAKSTNYGRSVCYLTNWTLTTLVVYFLASSIATFAHRNDSITQSLNLFEKIIYLTFELGFTWSCVVVLLYWVGEFPVAPAQNKVGISMYINVSVHGITLFWITLDLFMNRVIFVMSHVLYVMIMALLYCCVNAAYSLTYEPLYNILRWASFWDALVLLGTLLLILIFFTLGRLLVRLRERWSPNKPFNVA
eukprot:TRINITY_DN2037_c0_g1_i1.p1 TRINITY_DN2037_c0_g1~~TRINITY_DN2037_c0_g1_i1.p1  ORF type:complete len:254 (-),score=57.54 TRINITY_DN2037_c0_g1_i1:196-957(-)